MPCDTVTTQTISGGLERALPEHVKQALETAGFSIQFAGLIIRARKYGVDVTWQQGSGLRIDSRTRYSQPEALKAEIITAYAGHAVTWAAKRAGWNVTQTADREFTLAKR